MGGTSICNSPLTKNLQPRIGLVRLGDCPQSRSESCTFGLWSWLSGHQSTLFPLCPVSSGLWEGHLGSHFVQLLPAFLLFLFPFSSILGGLVYALAPGLAAKQNSLNYYSQSALSYHCGCAAPSVFPSWLCWEDCHLPEVSWSAFLSFLCCSVSLFLFVVSWRFLGYHRLFWLAMSCEFNHHDNWIFPAVSENLRENQDENFVQGFVWSLGGLLCTYLHPPSKADEVSCESWQFVTAIHYEGDSLTLCEWHSLGCDCTHSCHVSFGFAGSNRTVALGVLLWSFLRISQTYSSPLDNIVKNGTFLQ